MTEMIQESGAARLAEALPSETPVRTATVKPAPAWANWVLPSFADIIFLALICTVVFRPVGTGLLGDADTGWHIRNGEQIIATHVVPRVDPFSYTKAGQPWFAWEWLYDVGIAAIHHVSGLNGVVLFTLILVCSTFALLFRLLIRRCGNLLVAACLTLLAAGASQIHLLARPHVFSWLFSLLWVEILYRFNEGKAKALFWLPPLMLIWVNVHGGFILGLVLIGIFGCGTLWHYFTAGKAGDLRRIWQLSAALGACLLATLATPYGYQLYEHVYKYLSNDFLMNSINEFSSPNFHAPGLGYFELLLIIAAAGCALAWERLTVFDLLLVVFSMHAGLFAARNIPISGVFMSMALCRAVTSAVSPRHGSPSRPKLVSIVLERLDGVSVSMTAMEGQLRGHLLVIFLMACCCAIALNGGRIRATQVMDAHFDPDNFPVKATEFLAQKGVQTDLYSTDAWSGYLIYKLYPNIHLFFDDRHDFYGEAFVKEYLEAYGGAPGWQKPLDTYHVKWVMVPVNLPLTSILRESRDWQVEYSDKVAVVFSRKAPAAKAGAGD